MNGHRMRRRTALFLILVLLFSALPAAAADDTFTPVTVTYHILFTENSGTVTLYKNAEGYFLTADDAETLSCLTRRAAVWEGPNGFVRLRPNLSPMSSKTSDGLEVYPLTDLMDRLQTGVFVSADAALCVIPAAANLDALWSKTDEIMRNEGYHADIMEDMGELGAGAVRAFAACFDVVRNLRYDALWGQPERERLQEMLTKVLSQNGSSENILTWSSGAAETVSDLVTVVLGGQEYVYDSFWRGLGEVIPGEGVLLFGKDGTGTLRELMEASKQLDGASALSCSDYLDIASNLAAVMYVSTYYADCMQTLIDQVENSDDADWNSYRSSAVCTSGQNVLKSFERYSESERKYLLVDGVSKLTEAYVNHYFSGKIGEAIFSSGAVSVVDSALRLIDEVTFQSNKKNSAVLQIAAASTIQNVFYDMYALAEAEDDLTPYEKARLMQSAAVLYLRSAWESYDSVSFDSSLAGSIDRVQGLIDGALLELAAFTPAMFYYEGNAPIASGKLREVGEITAPEGQNDLYHEQFTAYAAGLDWLQYTDYLGPDSYYSYADIYGGGIYCFCDLDWDGIDELLIKADFCHADGTLMVFCGSSEGVRYLGGFNCGGFTGLFSCGNEPGVLIAQTYGGESTWSRAEIVDGTFRMVEDWGETDIPESKQSLEEHLISDLRSESTSSVDARNCSVIPLSESYAAAADFTAAASDASDADSLEAHVFAVTDSAGGVLATFVLPLHSGCTDFVNILAQSERYLVAEVTTDLGDLFAVSYDAENNAFVQLPSLSYSAVGDCLVGRTSGPYDVYLAMQTPYSLQVWGIDGTFIANLVSEKYGLYGIIRDGCFYYSFVKEPLDRGSDFDDVGCLSHKVTHQIRRFDPSSGTAELLGEAEAFYITDIGSGYVVSENFVTGETETVIY